MKAIWNNTIIAQAPRNDLIRIEGNWYFPPGAVNQEFLQKSDHHTICPWKGQASYYDVVVDDQINESAAWYYPVPKAGSIERVKADYTNYVAFWHGVDVIAD